jgi:sugar lactone lactonase YvrE
MNSPGEKMIKKTLKKSKIFLFSALFLGITLCSIKLQSQPSKEMIHVDIDSAQWLHVNSQKSNYMGRKCMMGTAYLKDIAFENGIIEVDVAVSGQRSFPGVIFRVQSLLNFESFYIRPHRPVIFDDVLQYTPVINRQSAWQLYSGPGFTEKYDVPTNKWIHLRLEIKGYQARVFIDHSKTPSLVIPHLKHGFSKGSIGINGPRNTSAYFSNFRYRHDDSLEFYPEPEDLTPGMIRDWQLSQPIKISRINMEQYPDEQTLKNAKWQAAVPEPSGLVNVARYAGRLGPEPDIVLAKAVINSEKDQIKKYQFGYSDIVSVFLNGKILFFGNNTYKKRGTSFNGNVLLEDALYLPLKKGKNQLLFMVAESFGGWGFMCRDASTLFRHQSIEKSWETPPEFRTPESVLYDPVRNRLYISNYDRFNPSYTNVKQSISLVQPDGSIEKKDWITGLTNPSGMVLYKSKLFIVERKSIAEFDTESGGLIKRHPIPNAVFPNDIAVDKAGNLYISDSGKSVIYRFADGAFEEWFSGDQLKNPNGIFIHKNRLLIGNTGDHCLKAIDIASKEISRITCLGNGTIDGIKVDKNGNFLVSHWEGRLFKVTASGKVSKILDTTGPGFNIADFEYIASKNLLVIPNYSKEKVSAFTLK